MQTTSDDHNVLLFLFPSQIEIYIFICCTQWKASVAFLY